MCNKDSLLTNAKIMPFICLLPYGTVEGWGIYTFPVMSPTTMGESSIRTASQSGLEVRRSTARAEGDANKSRHDG